MGLFDWIGRWFSGAPPPAPKPPPVRATAPATMDEVVARMLAIQGGLPADDGVAQFNRMYLRVTEEVRIATSGVTFENPEFLALLDVAFANLYFKALDDWAESADRCSRAWIPLIEARSDRRVAPIQFALAGMNAHINHDLVVAVVDTCRELGIEPVQGSPEHRDFVLVNRILAEVQQTVEPWFKRGLLRWIDTLLGHADEVVEMWSMERAREAAWIQAEALWALSDQPPLAGRFLLTLDRTVGFAGRGLLMRRVL